MQKLKIIKFWVVAFTYIIFQTIKNREWNMILVDFEIGENGSGFPIRKQLIADKRCGGMSLRWQGWPDGNFEQVCVKPKPTTGY